MIFRDHGLRRPGRFPNRGGLKVGVMYCARIQRVWKLDRRTSKIAKDMNFFDWRFASVLTDPSTCWAQCSLEGIAFHSLLRDFISSTHLYHIFDFRIAADALLSICPKQEKR